MINNETVIVQTKKFVKIKLDKSEAGHDWWHCLRVFNLSEEIAKNESADILVVQLAALLHDIADSKFYDGDEEIGPKIASDFLMQLEVPREIIAQVIFIIRNISYKNSFDQKPSKTIELEIVQDADRLDAIGAIGIARAFTYGGFKNRELYNPAIKPIDYLSKEDYKSNNSPTINHFYEKLLKLKNLMNTQKGRELAAQRHKYMEVYLEQFYKEWNGESKIYRISSI